MPLNNVDLISQFIPEVYDGDTFYYTEILDRRKRSGNNRGRRIREFIHRDKATFLEQSAQIIEMCEYFQARAYTRLSARSFRLVGMSYVKTIVEQALTANWEGMRHAYAKAMGTTPAKEKRWLFDVDHMEDTPFTRAVEARPEFVCVIPSRKGRHLITKPFNVQEISVFTPGVPPQAGVNPLVNVDIQLHRDNPTNLYVPSGAA